MKLPVNHIATATVSNISKSFRIAYKNEEINAILLKPAAEYGPFYFIGGNEFNPTVSSKPGKEHHTWLGFQKPVTKKEAVTLYHLKEPNPMSHLHTIMIKVPEFITDAFVFVGPVNGGSGIQLNMNSSAAQCAQSIKVDLF